MEGAPQIPISAIAEYLALAISLGPASPREDYITANRLLFTLATMLPAGLFRIVKTAALTGDAEQIIDALIMVRAAIGSLGSLDLDDAYLHLPAEAMKRRLN